MKTRKNARVDCHSNNRDDLTLDRIKQPLTKTDNDLDEGCCTVIVQITDGHNVVAFRRDAEFPAEIIITQNCFYGKNAEIQYKVTGGLFYHTVITNDGWIIGTGGVGTTYNQELMLLTGQILENGIISPDSVQKAQSILTNMGVGHLLIKSPDNHVGLVITSEGTTLNKLFKMQDGEFVSVPNVPQYYREGDYGEFNSNPLIAGVEIIGTDLWGVNRRDVIIHEVQTNADKTKLKLWAAFDDGSLINRNSEGGPDDIRFFKDQVTYGEKLSTIPDLTKIGEINLEG